jgi:hypothetical protein
MYYYCFGQPNESIARAVEGDHSQFCNMYNYYFRQPNESVATVKPIYHSVPDHSGRMGIANIGLFYPV